MQSTQAISEGFERFARLEVRGASPLYERLALGLAADPELLSLAAHARKGQPVPNLFMAAAHWLLLEGVEQPVSAFYPSVASSSTGNGDPYPPLQVVLPGTPAGDYRVDFHSLGPDQRGRAVRQPDARIHDRGAAVWGQTNLVVENGTSAGLNLLWDRYGYSYGDRLSSGDPASTVQLSCALMGSHCPTVPKVLPSCRGWDWI